MLHRRGTELMEFRGVQISRVLTLRELCGRRHAAVNEFVFS